MHCFALLCHRDGFASLSQRYWYFFLVIERTQIQVRLNKKNAAVISAEAALKLSPVTHVKHVPVPG